MEIHTLDLNFQGVPSTIASYLVIGEQAPALIETGPQSTLPTLLARLAEHGYAAADIGHVLVTHIHLDHAGAAGWWGQQGAQVYVHPLGAPHLVDPNKLLRSAARIYGEQMNTLWGETVPAPAERITVVHDGEIIKLAGLTIEVIDTPGHAFHHHVYKIGDTAFSGDAAGIRIHGTNFVDLPAPPPEFHLEHWHETINRLKGLPLNVIYPTHFGRVNNWRRQLETLSELMNEVAAYIQSLMELGYERDDILARYTSWHRKRALIAGLTQEDLDRYETANPLYMSVDGIMRYWRKKTAT